MSAHRVGNDGSARLTLRTDRLIKAAARLTDARAEAVFASACGTLSAPGASAIPSVGRSALNHDGVPLQLCLSASVKGSKLRLLGDPWTNLPVEARYEASIHTLLHALEIGGAPGLRAATERTLALVVPETKEARAAYNDGFVWVALTPGSSGIAFYLEASPLGVEGGWQVAERWLAEVLPASGHALELIGRLAQTGVVASLGLEGANPVDARAKVYFRLAQPTSLESLGVDLLVSTPVMRFLDLVAADRSIDLDGLVMSAGFSLATGELADVKLDLCGHCLAYSAAEWLDVIERCRSEYNLAEIPVEAALASEECEVAFLGLGVDVNQTCRLNVYLKDKAGSSVPDDRELRAALEDAVRYLSGIQREDGAWTDYHLPVGASDQWVSAYVGCALARVGRTLEHPQALEAAQRAALWLSRERTYPAGWGYNGRVGPDADSTAMAIALLSTLGMHVLDVDRHFLLQHWRHGRGMATYANGPQAWSNAHWDVTPWGYLGLEPRERRRLLPEFLAALEGNRNADGTWRAYWWRTPLYSTFLTLEALSDMQMAEPEGCLLEGSLTVDNSFDLACAVGIGVLRRWEPAVYAGPLRALLDRQQLSGGWSGAANLRVTDESCYQPWVEPKGAYFEDNAGTITTATVLRSMTHLLRSGAYRV